MTSPGAQLVIETGGGGQVKNPKWQAEETMDEIETLKRRVTRLEATNAIERLAHAYNVSVDTHDVALLPRIFSRDARILFAGQADGKAEGQAMPRRDEKDAGLAQKQGGIAGIIDMYQTLWDNLGPSYHWAHGHLIDFDEADENRATGLVMAHAETYRYGEGHLTAMRYNDAYIREDGAWKIAERTINFHYFCKASEYPQILSGRDRVTTGAAPRPADWPEGLPTWTTYRG